MCEDCEEGEIVCDNTGICEVADDVPISVKVSNCVHCGKELHQDRNGRWKTWDANFQ